MLIIVLALFALGLALLRLAGRKQAATGLPPGRVVYLDTTSLKRLGHTLYDPMSALTGRPDYLVEGADGLVPVELKSGRGPLRPYPGHVLQLAGYCLLVQTVYGVRPKYGVVKYSDRTFAVDYTSTLENELLDTLAEMRRTEGRIPDRSHTSPNRCRSCSFQEVCDQVLA
ncbi:MAG: Dna2/Cas4 domain-containing protein [Anaerolineales bacterium]|nr:Dna2/Cas4 domain-containing protein [Anaerolineales bacterium]